MGKRKSRPVPCLTCGREHDLNLDGWVILGDGKTLICSSDKSCWRPIYERDLAKLRAPKQKRNKLF
jgi:hypothetical protein